MEQNPGEERINFPFEVVEWVAGRRNGVYSLLPTDGDVQPEPVWICSVLRITARTRDTQQEAHGRVLEFADADGHVHRWAMPMSLLAGDSTELRSILLAMGLELSPTRKARESLVEYLQRARPEQTARCVERTGWYHHAFVLPDQTIGQTHETILFQTAARVTPGFMVRGSLAEWQQGVSLLCRDNSRLMLAVSMAFAAPLLHLVGEESGGINLVGHSSTGKSSIQRAAASVWGEKNRLLTWKSTSNGLEGQALAHNDTLMCLEELGQSNAQEVGDAAYLLANGVGKARAGRDGAARRLATWRVLILSSGEVGLAKHMRSGGKRAMAGQEVRLVDLPADAGAGMGVFDTLHGFADGAELATAISRAAADYHGVAARDFLAQLTTNVQAATAHLEAFRRTFVASILPDKACGQTHRVAGRFALIAAGGEMATAMGITGWNTGNASWAVRQCFACWLQIRGGVGSQEETALLAQVRLFFEKHGEARFTPWQGYKNEDRATINRAGFMKEKNGQLEYYVLPETFRAEICEGFDVPFATRVLRERETLLPAPDGRNSIKPRLPGMGVVRCYHMIPARLEKMS